MQGHWGGCLGFEKAFPSIGDDGVSLLSEQINSFLEVCNGSFNRVGFLVAIVTIIHPGKVLGRSRWLSFLFFLFFLFGKYEALGVLMLDFRGERSISTGRSFYWRRGEREGLELNRIYLASHSALSYVCMYIIPTYIPY